MRFRDRDIWLGITLIVLSVFGLTSVSTIKEGLASSKVTPKMYPTILFVLLIVCGVALIVQGICRAEKKPFPKFNIKRVLPLIGLLLLYAFVLDLVGFVIATFVFLVCAMLLLGERSPVPILAISFVFSAGVYFVFTKFLMIPLP